MNTVTHALPSLARDALPPEDAAGFQGHLDTITEGLKGLFEAPDPEALLFPTAARVWPALQALDVWGRDLFEDTPEPFTRLLLRICEGTQEALLPVLEDPRASDQAVFVHGVLRALLRPLPLRVALNPAEHQRLFPGATGDAEVGWEGLPLEAQRIVAVQVIWMTLGAHGTSPGAQRATLRLLRQAAGLLTQTFCDPAHELTSATLEQDVERLSAGLSPAGQTFLRVLGEGVLECARSALTFVRLQTIRTLLQSGKLDQARAQMAGWAPEGSLTGEVERLRELLQAPQGRLQAMYTWRDPHGCIEGLLEAHPEWLPLLRLAPAHIQHAFPGVWPILAPERDPELGYTTLWIMLPVDMEPHEALERLEALDQGWWLKTQALAGPRLGLDTEFL